VIPARTPRTAAIKIKNTANDSEIITNFKYSLRYALQNSAVNSMPLVKMLKIMNTILNKRKNGENILRPLAKNNKNVSNFEK
jgi:hypothetical protein